MPYGLSDHGVFLIICRLWVDNPTKSDKTIYSQHSRTDFRGKSESSGQKTQHRFMVNFLGVDIIRYKKRAECLPGADPTQ